jgi:hypothetical protein
MRRLLAVLTAIAFLVAAASALAVLPKGGKTYKGTTSAPKFGKFKDPVSFKTAQGGHLVSGFQFGFLSCQGVGGPPPTSNPYTQPNAIVAFGKMGISGDGKFTGTGTHTVNGTKTTATVHGKFKKRKKRVIATGTLSVSQTFQGGQCGPTKLTFSAKAK